MYISITPQKLEAQYGQSVADFVSYLEKENEGLPKIEQEHFFNQYEHEIPKSEVIFTIDNNTKKLKKKEPKFYSLTVSPSKQELQHLKNHSEDLKAYTRAFMKDYAASFNRELAGRKVGVDDIVYFAKIEHQRSYKGTDIQVKENTPFRKEIAKLKNNIQKVQRGELLGSVSEMENRITKLTQQAPHKIQGKMIAQGMKKEGNQSHIHIIVSRKDVSNNYSLSPGSKYKASEVTMNGKIVKRGFDRDLFFSNAEKTFDKKFNYQRNYVERYTARKEFIKNPKLYYSALLGLPTNQKAIAYKILRGTGMHIPNIPMSKIQLALKVVQKIKKGLNVAMKSSSIGI